MLKFYLLLVLICSNIYISKSDKNEVAENDKKQQL